MPARLGCARFPGRHEDVHAHLRLAEEARYPWSLWDHFIGSSPRAGAPTPRPPHPARRPPSGAHVRGGADPVPARSLRGAQSRDYGEGDGAPIETALPARTREAHPARDRDPDILRITDGMLSTPSEANHAFTAARTMFRWATTRRYIPHSPMEGLKLPAKARPRSRVLTPQELRLAFAYGRQTGVYGQIVRLLILTGQRVRPDHQPSAGIYQRRHDHLACRVHERQPRAHHPHRYSDPGGTRDILHAVRVQKLVDRAHELPQGHGPPTFHAT